ncbi:MAG: hypothetical protein IRZ08_07485 [Frankia sp.]|nr:hypothetical protein [Frankia sp.]
MTLDARIDQLVTEPGPFVTVYLGQSEHLDDLGPERGLRWRSLREQLARDGADEATLRAVDAVIPELDQENAARAIIASASRLRLCEKLHINVPDRATWGALPSVVPLIADEQSRVPAVVVETDRTGARIEITEDGENVRFAGEVKGPDDEIERNAPGGWSQRRYQDRAEDSWAHNAEQVAKAVTDVAERVDAGVVAVSGDVRAVQLLREHLPPRVAPLLRELHHAGPHPNGDRLRERELVELVSAEAQARSADLLARFVEERGRGEAADGVADTLAALARAQAETVLVADDPADDRVAWFGPGPGEVADSPDQLAAITRGQPRAARLTDVAVRAARATGATVHALPTGLNGGPSAGMGAILRY